MKIRCVQLFDSGGKLVERSGWAKVGGLYHVLTIWIEPGRTRLRLIGENPTPALFEPEMFEIVSSVIPPTWVATSQQPGYFELGPAAWARRGFWEEFFDGRPEAVACFEEERNKILRSDP